MADAPYGFIRGPRLYVCARGSPRRGACAPRGSAQGKSPHGPLHNQSLHVARLSAVCLFEGCGEEAGQHASQALALARRHGERGFEAFGLCQLGAVCAQADPPEVAQGEAQYRMALALAEALGMRPLVAHCHLGLGILYAKIGWSERARAELSAAIDLYRAMDMTLWLPQAEARLAQLQ
jgi:hypothetical protein